MKNTRTNLLWAFAATAVVAVVVIPFGFPKAILSVLEVLPILLLTLWLYSFTANRPRSWLRLAILFGLICCIVGDALFAWVTAEAPNEMLLLIVQAFYLASYAFYAGGYATKSSVTGGYLRQSPLLLSFILGHYVLLGAMWGNIMEERRFQIAIYSLFVMAMLLAVGNARAKGTEKPWIWSFAGVYMLVWSDLWNAYHNSSYLNIVGVSLYLAGQFLLVVGTGLMVRHER